MTFTSKSSRPVVIIDGLNVFTRHYIANPSMTISGEPIGGLVGFLKNIRFLCERFNPDKLVVAWEGGGSARRRARDKNYKGGRRPIKLNRYYEDLPNTVQNRDKQLLKTINFLRMLPVVQVYVPDCEGDDIVAYMARSTFRENKCIIVSSDKDFYQCISDRVWQWSPGRKKTMTPDAVLEEFGVLSTNFCLARSFVGDSSDNIQGVKGAGFKSMAKRFPILSEEDDVILSDILEESDIMSCKKKSPALYKRISESKEEIKKNFDLMKLSDRNISASQVQKIDGSVENYEFSPDKIGLVKLFLKEQINNFDIDSLWVATYCLRKQ